MQKLRDDFSLDAFFARVASARARVLMLDYDGTLAPFRPDPATATPYPELPSLLDAIIDAGHTRLVIVSGRWTKDLLPLLGMRRHPELWGSHGWERLHPSGDYDLARIRPAALQVLVAADDWILELEKLGARAERKPASVAFHWRGLPAARSAQIQERLAENWEELAHNGHLEWHEFDGGIELRATGRNKGYVVRTLAQECGEEAALAYLGDDLTDEDAFKAMPPGNCSVLVRPAFRQTAADLWIRPPDELIAFLQRWQEAAGEKS